MTTKTEHSFVWPSAGNPAWNGANNNDHPAKTSSNGAFVWPSAGNPNWKAANGADNKGILNKTSPNLSSDNITIQKTKCIAESLIFIIIMLLMTGAVLLIGISFFFNAPINYIFIGIALGIVAIALVLHIVRILIKQRSLLNDSANKILQIRNDSANKILLQIHQEIERITSPLLESQQGQLIKLHDISKENSRIQTNVADAYLAMKKDDKMQDYKTAVDSSYNVIKTRHIFPNRGAFFLAKGSDNKGSLFNPQTKQMEFSNHRVLVGYDDKGNRVTYLENSIEQCSDLNHEYEKYYNYRHHFKMQTQGNNRDMAHSGLGQTNLLEIDASQDSSEGT